MNDFDYLSIQESKYPLYMTKMPANFLNNNSEILRQSENSDGVQRFADEPRIEAIAEYCEMGQPLFPTPIVISINSDFIIFKDSQHFSFKELSGSEKPMSIIDGQHRLLGIKKYEGRNDGAVSPILPVTFVLDANVYQSADIFVTINANQKKVDTSSIYELFGLMEKRGGTKTIQSFANRVVSYLNGNEHSPFYDAIKMLGRKTNNTQFISQGTIANKIINEIQQNENQKGRQFTQFYKDDEDAFLAKAMINFFNAFETQFSEIWEDQNSNIKSAIGFSSLMKLFVELNKLETDFSTKNLKEILSNINGKMPLKNHQKDLEHILKSTKNKNEMPKYTSKSKTDEMDSQNFHDLFYRRGSSESVATDIGKELIRAYLLTKFN